MLDGSCQVGVGINESAAPVEFFFAPPVASRRKLPKRFCCRAENIAASQNNAQYIENASIAAVAQLHAVGQENCVRHFAK